MVQFNIDFLGTTVVDKLFSNPMIPWVIADVKRRKKIQKVNLTIDNGEIIGRTENVVIFRHQTQNVHRFCLEPNNMRTFMYLLRDEFEPVYNVYLFQTTEFEDVVEIFQTMRENVREHPNMTKSHSSAATLTSLCPDISPTNSQFFEVLYVGKIKVSHRKVPETFIDDALEKIRLYELEKSRKLMEQINADNEKLKSTESVFMPNKGNCDTDKGYCTVGSVNIKKESDAHKGDDDSLDSKTSSGQGELKQSEGNRVCDGANKKNEVSSDSEKGKPDPVSEMRLEGRTNRARAGSLGVIETFRKKVDDANQNRTMLFYVGRSDLRLISPDRKQVLLHKMLKDINSCVQGIENNQHFGIISREVDSYFGYVFKCESDSVADHIVSAITQSFQSMRENKERSKQPVLSCEHCPMLWFHKLCAEIEGVNEKKTQLTILKKIETLPEEEQVDIHTKFLGAESSDIKEQNEFLMILLRTHCERKQTRHVHDTAETRSEFLNQVLGGNTIFMKAKRSLTSSFDQLLKRKGSQTDIFHSKESVNRKSDSTINESKNEECQRSYLTVGPSDGEIMRKEISKQMSNKTESNDLKKRFQKDKSFSVDPNKTSPVDKSSCPDISSLSTNNQRLENADLSSPDDTDTGDSEASKTPMINIFLKVGSASKSPPQDNFFPEETCQTPSGSWRQAIFNRVVTPGKADEADDKVPRKRTKEELRELWKTAINQQILLIRMEKENARLRASQEEATVKRIKLEYEELGSSNKEYMAIWDMVSNKDNRISSKCDSQILFQAVRQGIPRSKRGDVWHFLAVQFCLKQPPFDSTGFPNYDVPYEDLLKQLTSFQHAILIDLGRTFPNHSYFSSPLGPGQLALFNLLKAYSLLDPQVGYCQGLSFVAGVLLLHMSEDNAFLLLRHLMFRRGLRKQYLPDMAALQVQLYQLSRLIHDTLPKLYAHFDKNEIAPTLYAASWMLTLFASQFPLGFVTRVFDLLFMEHTTEVIFRVVMALLDQHKEELLKLTTFEEIMEYLKNDVPKMDSPCVDRIMRKVLTMDITKQLHEYEVEYHVLQEEMSTPRPELDQLKKVKIENKRLKDQNLALMDQLEMVNKNLNRLEKFRSAQQSTINKLETKIRSLEITVKVLGDFISETSEEHKDIEVPGQIRRIIANLEMAKQTGGKNETAAKKPFDKTAFFKRIHSSIDFHDKPHFSELCTPDDLPNGTTYKDHGKDERHEDSGKPNVIRGVPLKVIVDDDEEDIKKRLHQHSPNLTSKITSGVSSFFNSSHNQIIKNQKNKKTTQEPGLGNGINSKPIEVDSQRKHNFSSEIGSLNIKDSVIHSQKKEKSPNNNEIPNQMKEDTSVTSDPATDAAPKQIVTHFHPLDNCNDVNITYNGTTKLKSIKSGHKLIRNNTIDLIPVNNNGYLHISEDEMPSKDNKVDFSSKSMKETFTESF